MVSHDSNHRDAVVRAAERRGEMRYEGYLAASFTCSTGHAGDNMRGVLCHVTSLSPSSAVIESSVHRAIGDQLWLQIEGFGIVRCEVEGLRDSGFICTNRVSPDARRRLGAWVSLLRRRGGRLLGGHREHMRIRPRDARTVVTFDDGSIMSASLSDVSRSGTAVACDRVATIGETVAIGQVVSRVVRVFDGGFAAAFDHVLSAADADNLVAGYRVTAYPNSRSV